MKLVKPTNRAGHDSILFRVTIIRPDKNILDEPNVSVKYVSVSSLHITVYTPVSSCFHVFGNVTRVSRAASLGSLALLDIVTKVERN